MKTVLLCWYIIIYSSIGFSQNVLISNLIQIGDSVLNSTIGNSYSSFYRLDTSSYYKYHNWLKKSKKHSIMGYSTKGRFIEASLRYTLSYPRINELSSTLYLLISNDLKVEKFISDVPDFILENKPCPFITKDEIVNISNRIMKKKGLYVEFYLERDRITQSFVWKIYNIIKIPDQGKYVDGLMEIIEINPYNGDVINQEIVPYGRVF